MSTTVAFKELDGSPKEAWGERGMTATRTILCEWSSRRELVGEILGDGYQFGSVSPIEYPGETGVVAMSVSSERFGKLTAQELDELGEDLNSYDDFARLTINYKQLTGSGMGGNEPEHESGTILDYSASGAAEYVLLSPNGMTWETLPDQQVPEKAAPTQRVPLTQHHLTWHLVTSPPWAALESQKGTVNNAAFMGYEANTLLFDSCDVSKEFATAYDFANPQLYWKLEFTFLSRRFIGWVGYDADENLLPDVGYGEGHALCGWTHVWRPVPGTGSPGPAWDRLLLGGVAGRTNYVQSDFTNLLVYP